MDLALKTIFKNFLKKINLRSFQHQQFESGAAAMKIAIAAFFAKIFLKQTKESGFYWF